LICRMADFVESVTDVAVTVAVKGLVTDAGVLYVAVDVLCAVNVPPPESHGSRVQPLHDVCSPALR
jgi:hypothetical protein